MPRPHVPSPAAARRPRSLLALTAALLLFRLGAVPLLGPDEPRYARVAVEMQRARRVGDAHAAGPALAGEAAPLLLAGRRGLPRLGRDRDRGPAARRCWPRCSSWARRRSSARASSARRPGCTPASSSAPALLPFAYGRAACMDMLLAACVTAAIGLLGAAPARHRGRAWPCPPPFVVLGLAALAKGPLGLLLPGAGGRRATLLATPRPAAAAPRSSRPPRVAPLPAPWPRPGTSLVYRATRAGTSWTSSCSTTTSRASRRTVHNHPGPPVVLPARAAGRPLPVVGPARCPRSRGVAAAARPAPTSSCSPGCSLPLAVLLRSPARSCPATSCPACRRSPSSMGRAARPHGRGGARDARWARRRRAVALVDAGAVARSWPAAPSLLRAAGRAGLGR